MEDIKAITAENISKLRVANDMTQAELAKKLNYSDKAISIRIKPSPSGSGGRPSPTPMCCAEWRTCSA